VTIVEKCVVIAKHAIINSKTCATITFFDINFFLKISQHYLIIGVPISSK